MPTLASPELRGSLEESRGEKLTGPRQLPAPEPALVMGLPFVSRALKP